MKAHWKGLLTAGTLAGALWSSSLAARAVTVQDTVAWLAQNGYTLVAIEVSDDGKTIEVKAVLNGAVVEMNVDVETGAVTIDDAGDDHEAGAGGGDGTPPATTDGNPPTADGTPPASDDKDSGSGSASGSASTSDPSASDSDSSDSSSSDLSDSSSDSGSSDDLSDSSSSP